MDQIWVSCTAGRHFTSELPLKPFEVNYALIKKLLKDNDQGTQSQCSETTRRDRVGNEVVVDGGLGGWFRVSRLLPPP